VARIAEAGLSDRVEIKLQDYRDERGSYDGIASIEMFEAVGEKYWPVYFDTLRERLKPGRQATLQIITVQDRRWEIYKRGVDFIQKYIFPGGMLPAPKILRQQVQRAGLEVAGSIEFGESYSPDAAPLARDIRRPLGRGREAGLRRPVPPDVGFLPVFLRLRVPFRRHGCDPDHGAQTGLIGAGGRENPRRARGLVTNGPKSVCLLRACSFRRKPNRALPRRRCPPPPNWWPAVCSSSWDGRRRSTRS
jgi:hypothetical protein